jgi:hypothetical protein
VDIAFYDDKNLCSIKDKSGHFLLLLVKQLMLFSKQVVLSFEYREYNSEIVASIHRLVELGYHLIGDIANEDHLLFVSKRETTIDEEYSLIVSMFSEYQYVNLVFLEKHICSDESNLEALNTRVSYKEYCNSFTSYFLFKGMEHDVTFLGKSFELDFDRIFPKDNIII